MLSKKDVLLLVVSKKLYAECLKKAAKALTSSWPNIFCMTFNTPFSQLSKYFESAGINDSKSVFADAVTEIKGKAELGNCILISDAKDIRALNDNVNYIFKQTEVGSMLVDFVPNPHALFKQNDFIKFLHIIIAKIRVTELKGILVVPAESIPKPLLDDLTMFVDEVLKLKTESN